jgi:hypothetical protein
VDVVATTPEGQELVFPGFRINVRAELPDLTIATKPFLVKADYTYQAQRVQRPITFNLAVAGGTAPFAVTVDWGDGTANTTERSEQSEFTVTHVYTTPGEYRVLVTITDALGKTATMQLLAVSTDPNITTAASISRTDGPVASVLSGIKRWIWLIAPAYLVVILMALSYWIGERQVYWRLMAGRRAGAHKGKAR